MAHHGSVQGELSIFSAYIMHLPMRQEKGSPREKQARTLQLGLVVRHRELRIVGTLNSP